MAQCSHRGIGVHNCVEGFEEAGVICTGCFLEPWPFLANPHINVDTTCEDGTVHLVGGDDVSRGRVEYCYQGFWYSVCVSGWDESGEEARVICSSLGYTFGK